MGSGVRARSSAPYSDAEIRERARLLQAGHASRRLTAGEIIDRLGVIAGTLRDCAAGIAAEVSHVQNAESRRKLVETTRIVRACAAATLAESARLLPEGGV